MPHNFEWNGAPEQSEFGGGGKCGRNQFKLNPDTALAPKGGPMFLWGTLPVLRFRGHVLRMPVDRL